MQKLSVFKFFTICLLGEWFGLVFMAWGVLLCYFLAGLFSIIIWEGVSWLFRITMAFIGLILLIVSQAWWLVHCGRDDLLLQVLSIVTYVLAVLAGIASQRLFEVIEIFVESIDEEMS
jgi:hypothetical protein